MPFGNTQRRLQSACLGGCSHLGYPIRKYRSVPLDDFTVYLPRLRGEDNKSTKMPGLKVVISALGVGGLLRPGRLGSNIVPNLGANFTSRLETPEIPQVLGPRRGGRLAQSFPCPRSLQLVYFPVWITSFWQPPEIRQGNFPVEEGRSHFADPSRWYSIPASYLGGFLSPVAPGPGNKSALQITYRGTPRCNRTGHWN